MLRRKLFGASTYTSEAVADRHKEKEAEHRIIQHYSSRIIRWYCRMRFHIINLDFLDAMEQHLPADAKVLDIGCGFGLFSLYYAMRQSQRSVTGFDLSEARITEANAVAQKLNLQNVHFFCQDAAAYEFAQEYDVVVTLDLLHHISAEVAEALITKAYQALAPGGIFLIKDVNTKPFHKLLFTYLLDMAMMPRLSVHYRDAASWRSVLMKTGFTKVWYYPLKDYLPYPHMLLVAQKPYITE